MTAPPNFEAMQTPFRSAPPLSPWTRWPPSSPLGIVSGGTSDLFSDALSFGNSAACFLEAYAARHVYALYIERQLERFNMTRHAAWAKLPLIVALLQSQQSLPILVWIDLDIVILNDSVPILPLLLHMPNCSRVPTLARCYRASDATIAFLPQSRGRLCMRAPSS